MTITEIQNAIRAWFLAITELPSAQVYFAQQSAPRPAAEPFATINVTGYGAKNIDALVPVADRYQIRVSSFTPLTSYTLKVNGTNYTFTTGVTPVTTAVIAAGVAAAITAPGITKSSTGDIVHVSSTDVTKNCSVFVVAGPMVIIAGDGQNVVGDRVVNVTFQTFGIEAQNVMGRVIDRHRGETFLQLLWSAGVTLFRFEPLTNSAVILEAEWEHRAIAIASFGVRSTYYDAVGTIEKVEVEGTVLNEVGLPVLMETLTTGV